MIHLERRVAWLFRAALKRCLGTSHSRNPPSVQLRLTSEGLMMHASAPEIAIIHTDPSQTGKGVFTFPISRLEEFEGRTTDQVEINLLRPNMVGARWTHQGRTREMEIPLVEPETVAKVPELPKKFAPAPLGLLTAIHDAGEATAPDATKYAITRVQLRGKTGQVVGTDTRHLLVFGGFEFPFTEDLLIPSSGVFGLQQFLDVGEVSIGKTETHLVIQVGPWKIAFFIDKQGRYPDVASIVPKQSQANTRFHLDADDAQSFLDSLARRIKGPAANEHAVTLDLLETPCLRYEIDGRVTEVNLVNSTVTGNRLRMCLKLSQFLRALELRFQDFEIRDADKPFLARDSDRLYLAMPLSSAQALAPRPDAFKVSTPKPPMPSKALAPIKRRTRIVVPVGASRALAENGINILSEAEGLREGLFKVATHAGKILRFLRNTCTQKRIFDLARTSLLALGNQTTGDKP